FALPIEQIDVPARRFQCPAFDAAEEARFDRELDAGRIVWEPQSRIEVLQSLGQAVEVPGLARWGDVEVLSDERAAMCNRRDSADDDEFDVSLDQRREDAIRLEAITRLHGSLQKLLRVRVRPRFDLVV